MWKFSLNNSIIPVLFYSLYLFQISTFLYQEGVTIGTILVNISALLLGSVLTISFSFTYFLGTIQSLEEAQMDKGKESAALRPLQAIIKKDNKLAEPGQQSKVNYYLKNPFKIKLARDASHYQTDKLLKTIEEHHLSAAIYFILLIVIIVALSLVSGYKVFMIPAGATIFIIFSLYLMITGAFYSRLKTWTVTVGILVLLGLNYLSGFKSLQSSHYAFGLDYSGARVKYDYPNLDDITSDSIRAYDKAEALKTLEKWRSKFSGEKKPKLVILNVSGGGLRSSLWSTKVLLEADKASKGTLHKQTHLITGSSGGMLGAAYFRELKHKYQGTILHSDSLYLANIAKDALNPVTFTLAVNDLFIKLRKVEVGGIRYPLDRGYAFDKKFEENTEGLLSHNLGYYQSLEANAAMPTMILAPTIVGDGRKLLMSTQGMSYLTYSKPYRGLGKTKEFDAVEYGRLFQTKNPYNLSFVTALRMSASFPYITPLINLPSEPTIELIDAGARDNEGFELGLRYIYEFKEWINENTNGVIIVQLKANRPDEIPIQEGRNTKLDQLTNPINGIVQSFHNLQIYNKALLMQLSDRCLDVPVDIVRFSLFSKKDEVSLSWHLTEKEKKEILSAFDNEANQTTLKKLESLLSE